MGRLSRTRDRHVDADSGGIFPRLEGTSTSNLESLPLTIPRQEEAFEIWTEWSRLYPLRSASRKLLQGIADNAWLVSVIHHDYKDPEGLWRFLLGEEYEVVRQKAQKRQ